MSDPAMTFDEAIEIIESKSVYRLQARVDESNGKIGGMFNSTNGMPTTRWTNKQVMDLAAIVKNKPEGMN